MILVTGCAGFIGYHATRALLERGDTVIGVDNFNDYYDTGLKEARITALGNQNKFTLHKINIEDKPALAKLFAKNKFDAVCHLAAQAGVRYSLENPDVYISTNVAGTHNLFELAREHKVPKFILASSASVYGGNTKVPFSETDAVDKPLSLYAATKRYNELEAHAYHSLYGLNVYCLRFFNVIGTWGRPDQALYKFTKAILADEQIDVYNNGEHKRDFTYVDDIAAGVLAAIDGCNGYEIINLGNHKPVDLEYFISLIEKSLGKTATKNYLPLQPGDVVETYADNSKAKKLLGWQPSTNIEQGVEKFIEWYKSYGA